MTADMPTDGTGWKLPTPRWVVLDDGEARLALDGDDYTMTIEDIDQWAPDHEADLPDPLRVRTYPRSAAAACCEQKPAGAWEPGRWHRIRQPDGTLWMETSDRDEAQAEAEETGWPLERLYVSTRTEWRYDNPEPTS